VSFVKSPGISRGFLFVKKKAVSGKFLDVSCSKWIWASQFGLRLGHFL